MRRILAVAIGGILCLTVAGANAASGPGQCFNGGAPNACSPANCPGDPNNPDCSANDTGCVSNTKNHKGCSDAIAKAFCGVVKCVIGCHKKQADARFKGVDATTADTAEDACEGTNASPDTEKSCGGKLKKAINKLITKGICDAVQISNANNEAAVLIGHPAPIPPLSLDGQNDLAYCDSASPALIGGEDDGWVPQSKDNLACADAEGKATGALICCALKCHSAMNAKFFAGKPFNEEACEESSNPVGKGCVDKFNKTRDKVIGKGICAPCNQQAGWDFEVANALGTVDGANGLAFPCGLP